MMEISVEFLTDVTLVCIDTMSVFSYLLHHQITICNLISNIFNIYKLYYQAASQLQITVSRLKCV
jgi:hypothetical protein